MAFSVPNPCPKAWAAMTPTADGRFCGSCHHEVVDFSQMTEVEVTAWLVQSTSGKVCGFFRAGQFAPVAAPQPRWRQWLLATIALLGLKPLLAAEEAAAFSPRHEAPRATEQADRYAEVPKGRVTIRGRVLDDSTGLGVPGAEIFIGDTKYGTVTDEQGNFSFTMKQMWEPVQKGLVSLRVQGSPFVFERQTLAVAISPTPKPLTIRLKSLKGRGQIMGKIRLHEPPRKLPLN